MAEDLGPWYEARQEIVDELERELMGPEDATPLDERPLNRIVVGVLHPRPDGRIEYMPKMESEGSQSDGRGAGSVEDEDNESAVALSHAIRPSSFGLTFTVNELETAAVSVGVSARRYREEDGRWHAVDIATDADLNIDTGSPRRIGEQIGDEPLRLVGIVRAAVDGMVRITLSLVNTAKPGEPGKTDAQCWFRPRITVRATPGQFVDRRRPRESLSEDPDTRSTDFLYRNEPALAIGHGCAVMWDGSAERVDELTTAFVPFQDVRLARPSGGDADDEFGTYDLDMEKLATSTDRAQLFELAASYERWIAARYGDAEAIAEPHRQQALAHIDLAKQCAERIRAGVEILDDPADPLVGRAFQLMNEAMLEQRRAQDRARGATSDAQRWRPFQIAFILMNLPAMARSTHPDRDIVDLLWFPTGGGKTEAYLGCIGFTILLRRLRRHDDGGVSAIMRYTLRLLTRQQFERAAGLICALELIRRREIPGSVEISLGLWVGDKASPNKVEDAQRILNSIASGHQPEGSTPVQLLRCPWCGTAMDHNNYEVIDKSRLEIRCSFFACEFSDRLPFYVTDDDVYRVRPSLLIGTVDKFAMMTWRSQVGDLLSVDGPHSRPDLIVQDELHLISGPLGTMVGLYESALDLACAKDGRPKVLASTATIRRAEHQVRNVFDRGSVQFPPPGLDPEDNYFAVEATPEQKGTRRYVGVMAPGTSQATLLVRVYSAMLQAVNELDVDDSVRDDYWTLLGYFNSLRVLGSTYLQVLDDVPDRVEVLAARKQTSARDVSPEPVELTSRVDQTRIPAAMARLETSYPDPGSPDVVLATNMISVGLDIDRLGLMVVAGQPQSTSEYIQSTSRVGRRHPGLVVVALNANRSRDASHYESFIPFHRALYREVEATTATPFASRARDRGAHGMLVAAVRLLVASLRGDASAGSIEKYREEIGGLIDSLVDRAQRISPEEAEPFRAQLSALVRDWEEAADAGLVDRYGTLRPPQAAAAASDGHPLLASTGGDNSRPGSFPVGEPPWPALSSMRDVDAETRLYVKNLKGSGS
ncbi:helicase [Rhodococcus hoagii]|nr:helicase [Prescottella equi]